MISTRTKFMLAAVVVIIAIRGSQCAAGIIVYDNLPPTPYYPRVLAGLGMRRDYVSQSAQQLTPASSGRLATLDLPILFGGRWEHADDLTLTIVSDDNGLPSAAKLWSQTYIDKVRSNHLPAENTLPLSFDVENGLILQAGTRYWLIATANPVYAELHHYWAFTSNATADPQALHIDNPQPDWPEWPVGEWFLINGMSNVEGTLGLRVTVIPEPAAAALMLAATATLLVVRRRSH